MTTQYAYFYLLRTDGADVAEAVPDHVAHWRGLGLDGYVGGPFEDRAGGLIIFQADTTSRAEQAVATDPFVMRGMIQLYWLKRWRPE